MSLYTKSTTKKRADWIDWHAHAKIKNKQFPISGLLLHLVFCALDQLLKPEDELTEEQGGGHAHPARVKDVGGDSGLLAPRKPQSGVMVRDAGVEQRNGYERANSARQAQFPSFFAKEEKFCHPTFSFSFSDWIQKRRNSWLLVL